MCLSDQQPRPSLLGQDYQDGDAQDPSMRFLIELHEEPTRVLIRDPSTNSILTELDEASSKALLADESGSQLQRAAASMAGSVADLLRPEKPVEFPNAGVATRVLEDQLAPAANDLQKKGRHKLWEIAHKLHCPVIGTCLDADELRRIAKKAGARPSGDLSDYDVHVSFVSSADEKNSLSLAAHKALEKKFARQVKRFNMAKSTAELEALWEEALARGDVPGGLWATLTHRSCDDGLRARAYEEIHMLSHQIGAGQRADLKRLDEAEAELLSLHREFDHAQRRQRKQLEEREHQIRTLEKALDNARLALRASETNAKQLQHDLAEQRSKTTQRHVDELTDTLFDHQRRLANAERQTEALELALSSAEQDVTELESEKQELAQDCTAMERFIAHALTDCDSCDADDCGSHPDLAGRRILCVGGRQRLIEQYRGLVTRCNGQFEHHDGGKEDNRQRLNALLNSADAVVCATDAVSHDAYYRLKRFCKKAEKPHVFLRTSGVSSFTRAIYRVAGHA